MCQLLRSLNSTYCCKLCQSSEPLKAAFWPSYLCDLVRCHVKAGALLL